jgi:hypothetical protein
MLMRACRHDEDQEKLTPCQFFRLDLTDNLFCYIKNMHRLVSEMSVFWREERLHVKKMLIM